VAKKSRRQSSRTSTTPVNPTGSSAVFTSSARSVDKEFNPDYSYVTKDLKRIGSLAAFFFTVLVVLSFFLK
jgi:hypothetical protein